MAVDANPPKERSASVKAAADRAEARARGEPIDEPKAPIDSPMARTTSPEPHDPPPRMGIADIPPPPDAPEIKIGKPTKFDPTWMLDKVIELGRFGKSKAQIARQLGVSDKTLTRWAEQHSEFAEAMEAARTLSLAWWEDAGQVGVFVPAKDFNVAAWHTQVKARFPQERAWFSTTSATTLAVAAIASIAGKIGCSAQTLANWVRRAERDAGERPGLTTDERERLKSLEREVRELRQANEILRKASAYFDGVDAPSHRHRGVPT